MLVFVCERFESLAIVEGKTRQQDSKATMCPYASHKENDSLHDLWRNRLKMFNSIDYTTFREHIAAMPG